MGRVSSTVTSSSVIATYTVSELNRLSITSVGMNLQHSTSSVKRTCKIASIIEIDILSRNLSLTIFTIENARSAAAFKNGRLRSPRTSFQIFSNFLFPPASVSSLISAQNFSVLVLSITSALWSKFHSLIVESMSLHKPCLNLVAIFVMSTFTCDGADCGKRIFKFSETRFCNCDARTIRSLYTFL